MEPVSSPWKHQQAGLGWDSIHKMLSDTCMIFLDLPALAIMQAGLQDIRSFAGSRNYLHPYPQCLMITSSSCCTLSQLGLCRFPSSSFPQGFEDASHLPLLLTLPNMMDILEETQKLLLVTLWSKLDSSETKHHKKPAGIKKPALTLQISWFSPLHITQLLHIAARVFQSRLKDSGNH